VSTPEAGGGTGAPSPSHAREGPSYPRPAVPRAPADDPSRHVEGRPDVEEVSLAREITLMDATMMGVGALMGGGVFVLLGLAAGVAGPAALLAFFLNGLITIPTLMIYAELGSAYHDAGGGYLWVKDALGQPFGFLGGWMGWFSHAVACALYSIASAAFILFVAEAAGWVHGHDENLMKMIAVGVATFFVFLNYIGVKVSIKSENVVNTLVLVAVLGFIVAGLWAVSQRLPLVADNFDPFFIEPGLGGALSTTILAMGVTFVAFEGYEIISQASEEIKNPTRNIPRAIWYSMLIVWGIILLVTFIAIGAVQAPAGLATWEWLGGLKERGLIEAASQIMPLGSTLIVGSALLLQLTALNATIYSSSRVSFAMGRDGNLPTWFGKIHPVRRTPHLSVWASGVIIVGMALLPIEAVAASTSLMFLLLFVLVNMSYVKLRNTIPRERFGYRAPLFPVIPILGIIGNAGLALYLYLYEPIAWYASIFWIVVGLGVYYVYVKPREEKQKAHALKASIVHRTHAPVRKNFRVLVPVSNPATARVLARTAGDIARSLDGEVLLLNVVVVPEVTPLSEGRAFAQAAAPVLHEAARAVPEGIPVHTLVRIGHNLPSVIEETAEQEGASLLLLGWRGSGHVRDWLMGSPTHTLVEYPPCDVAVLRVKSERTMGDVLIPTHGGAHAPLSIRLGTAIAKGHGGRATLYHVMGIDEEGAGARMARGQSLLEQNAIPGVEAQLDLDRAPRVISRLVEKSKEYGLVVVGATTESAWRNYLFGHKTEEVSDRAHGNVLMVKAHHGPAAHRTRQFSRRLKAIRRYLMPK